MKVLKPAIFLFVLLAFASCKEEFPPESGTVLFRISHSIDNGPFELNTNYDFNGQNVEFTDFRYYISNIQFKGEDGSDKDNPDKKAWLVTLTDSQLDLGQITDRSLFQTSFLVGLDAETNHEDPTMATEEGLMNNEMHWGWNPSAGYKFMRIEGKLDGVDFSYHVATDNLLSEISDFDIALINEDDATNTVDIIFDVRELFEGITLVDGQNHGENPITGEIVSNLQSNEIFKVQ